MTITQTRPSLPDTAAQRRPAAGRVAWLAGSLLVLCVLCVLSVAFGAREVTLGEITAGLGGDVRGVSEAAVQARIPRTVLAVLVGAALGLAGAGMQAVTRNPLADPGILGVSGGAALAVVIGIVFFGLADPTVYLVVAIIGAAVAAVFVYSVGSLGRGGATPAAFASLTSALLLPRVDAMETFRFWQIGGVGGATWDRIAMVLPVLAVGAVTCLLCARGMNSLALGDDLAAGLGENVFRTRLIAAAGAVILCGAATAVAGPIAFVGLVIPHICRLLVGTDHRWLLPFCAAAGAGLLVAADIIGRVIARPEEIEVGIITAFIGAPVFIWIVRRQRVREL